MKKFRSTVSALVVFMGLNVFCQPSFAAEAHQIADINPGASGSYPSNFFAFANNLYFSAYTLSNGFELWKYNGTTVELVADINDTFDDLGFGVKEGNDSLPAWLTEYNGALYFSAYDAKRGAELWRTDGTNVTRVADINPDLNDTIKFNPNSSWPSELTVFNNALYFSANSSATLTNYELFKYDGSSVTRVANIHPDIGPDQSSYPNNLTVFNGALYFMANDGVNGYELWKHDGTSTVLVTNINPGGVESSSYPKLFKPFNGQLYFQAYHSDYGFELWRTDGTNVTLAADIFPGAESSNPEFFTEYKGALYFRATDGVHGYELFKYDGQAATLAADINPAGDSYPQNLTVLNDTLYSSANDGVNGYELWKFDGAAASMVQDLNPAGDSSPYSFQVANDTLYFVATTPDTGYEPFQLTNGQITVAADINPGPGDSYPQFFFQFGNALIFRAAQDGVSDWEPWVLPLSAPQNQPPTVTIAAPTAGSTFQTTDPIAITAEASDDVAVAQVEFFSDGNSLGIDTQAPFSIVRTLPAGMHALTAIATDNLGATATSTPISITVESTPVTPPEITSVTQTAGSIQIQGTAPEGLTVTLEATTDFVTWSAAGTATSVNGRATFGVPTDGMLRFFRVSIP
jgi:ELWxxDGT repeat protein